MYFGFAWCIGVCICVFTLVKVGRILNGECAMEKGIAFPTCINVNQTVSNAALLPEDTRTLQEGDFVKM